MPTTTQASESFVALTYSMKVGDAECLVRAAAVWPIAELLDLESQFEPGTDTAARDHDAALVADVLDSRMIAPPRPRRRRERAVSSRAVFYAAVAD
jgi:hypothetical protein